MMNGQVGIVWQRVRQDFDLGEKGQVIWLWGNLIMVKGHVGLGYGQGMGGTLVW